MSSLQNFRHRKNNYNDGKTRGEGPNCSLAGRERRAIPARVAWRVVSDNDEQIKKCKKRNDELAEQLEECQEQQFDDNTIKESVNNINKNINTCMSFPNFCKPTITNLCNSIGLVPDDGIDVIGIHVDKTEKLETDSIIEEPISTGGKTFYPNLHQNINNMSKKLCSCINQFKSLVSESSSVTLEYLINLRKAIENSSILNESNLNKIFEEQKNLVDTSESISDKIQTLDDEILNLINTSDEILQVDKDALERLKYQLQLIEINNVNLIDIKPKITKLAENSNLISSNVGVITTDINNNHNKLINILLDLRDINKNLVDNIIKNIGEGTKNLVDAIQKDNKYAEELQSINNNLIKLDTKQEIKDFANKFETHFEMNPNKIYTVYLSGFDNGTYQIKGYGANNDFYIIGKPNYHRIKGDRRIFSYGETINTATGDITVYLNYEQYLRNTEISEIKNRIVNLETKIESLQKQIDEIKNKEINQLIISQENEIKELKFIPFNKRVATVLYDYFSLTSGILFAEIINEKILITFEPAGEAIQILEIRESIYPEYGKTYLAFYYNNNIETSKRVNFLRISPY